jgi:hypothetical protein
MTQPPAKPVFHSVTSLKLRVKPTAGSVDISEPRSAANLVFPAINSVRQQRVRLIFTSQLTDKITQLHRAWLKGTHLPHGHFISHMSMLQLSAVLEMDTATYTLTDT